ncbi:methyltransferase domain-containing protein [Roseibium porphyridii]|uniref:Methyltransferase domain-containing protein n=1 Tax=Roseibium porphyridii TaxID=2866279 RepID=A0ABY8F5C7_9HYPH|nr:MULTISPECIES: methyltransferase domain-containing protein [Stappiaceae]QFT29849.1 Malonyl-[acyl-carrier protein] O-methyltransferase [Labrenzia sp. THAF82]WFE90571.1 methyltransferase domain-containing protein [Roseibium sp. KMA01]
MTDQPDLFDRSLLRARRARALKSSKSGSDFLLQAIAEDLEDRLHLVNRQFSIAVDLGGHTGLISQAIRNTGKAERLVRADLFVADHHMSPPDLVCDDGLLPLRDQSVDLVISALSLQFVNDLPGALIQVRRSLRPDGLFLAALPGAGTLAELRDSLTRAELELKGGAAARVLPFADTRDLGSLLQRAGFALPVTDLDTLTVRYDSMFGLMADLRAMGATSILRDRSRLPLSRKVLFRAAELYAQNHADADGRIRATFAFVTLSGWAPHESQQKPLRPGAAKTRLADALGTREQKLK